MNKTTRLLGSLLIITIATSCGTGDKNQSAQTDDPLANSPIVGQYVQAGTDNVMILYAYLSVSSQKNWK